VRLRPLAGFLKRFSGSHSFSCANLDLYISTGYLDQKRAWHDGKMSGSGPLGVRSPPAKGLRTNLQKESMVGEEV
jgi:hypothetical protein